MSLRVAVRYLREAEPDFQVSLGFVDNDPAGANLAQLRRFADEARDVFEAIEVIHPGQNWGYGRAHNRIFMQADSDLHLVLNPDVIMAENALVEGLQYFRAQSSVCMLAPLVRNGSGEMSFLCKRYPSVVDLVLRGFAPEALKQRFQQRLAEYEMQHLGATSTPELGVPIASGCFMLARTSALHAVGGFSERFFLYFEDFDLCLRLKSIGEIAFVPAVEIVHLGGYSARKGWQHIRLFAASGFTFFQTHGWRWY